MNDDEAVDEFRFEFELLNSDDGKIVTLVCRSERELTPDEYAQALTSFAEKIQAIVSLEEMSCHTLN